MHYESTRLLSYCIRALQLPGTRSALHTVYQVVMYLMSQCFLETDYTAFRAFTGHQIYQKWNSFKLHPPASLTGTTGHLFSHAVITSANYTAAAQCINSCTKWDLHDLDHGMVSGARQVGVSISETVDLLGFPHTHTTVSRVYTEWCGKKIVWGCYRFEKKKIASNLFPIFICPGLVNLIPV